MDGNRKDDQKMINRPMSSITPKIPNDTATLKNVDLKQNMKVKERQLV